MFFLIKFIFSIKHIGEERKRQRERERERERRERERKIPKVTILTFKRRLGTH